MDNSNSYNQTTNSGKMPIYQAPTNDESRHAFLSRAAKTGLQDMKAGNVYLTEETHNDVVEFADQFGKKLKAISHFKSTRSSEYLDSSRAFDYMKTCMKDTWEVARRKVNRLNLPAQMLTYYELPLDGKSPNPTTYEQWYTLAAKMVEGAEKAEKAGYPPVMDPPPAELKEAWQKALKERDELAEVDRDYDQAQEGVEEMRARADELISDVMNELRFFLRKMDDPSQRRIMRTYGATFKYLRGEPEDETPEAEME